MPLFVDGLEVPLNGQPIIDAIEKSLHELEEAGRHVQVFLIDGAESVVSRLRAEHQDLSNESTIDVITCTLDELIESTMQSSFELIPGIYPRIEFVVTEFRVGNTDSATSAFADAVSALQWHADVLSYLAKLQPGPSFIHEMQERYSNVMQSVLNTLSIEDYISLADILQYELLPWMSQWFAGVEMFRQQMQVEHLKQGQTKN